MRARGLCVVLFFVLSKSLSAQSFSPTGSMHTPRASFTATLLPSGPTELFKTPLFTDSSLLSYWRLENDGTDSKGSNYLGATGSVGFDAGLFGNAADFGSDNSGKIMEVNSNLGLTGGPGSISDWFYVLTQPANTPNVPGTLNVGEYQNIVRWSENTHNTDLFIHYENNANVYTLVFARGRNSSATDTVTLPGQLSLNTWYHAVLTYDGTKLTGYLNGLPVGSVAASGVGSGPNPSMVAIGGHYNVSFDYFYPFKGKIDDVAVFRRHDDLRE